MLTQDMALLLYRISIAISYRIRGWLHNTFCPPPCQENKDYICIYIYYRAGDCPPQLRRSFSGGLLLFWGERKKEWKKSVKKCWQGQQGVVLYLSAKRWGKRMTSEAPAGSPWKEPIDAEKFQFVLGNFLSAQVQKVQKLLKNKAWQKTTSVVQ